MTAKALPNGGLDGAELQNGLHEVLQGDPSKLTLPIKAVQDKYELLPAFLKVSLLCLPLQLCIQCQDLLSKGAQQCKLSERPGQCQ